MAEGLVRYWFGHIALPFATTIIGVAALIALVNLAPSRFDPATGEQELYGWGNVAFIVAIFQHEATLTMR